MAQSAEHEVLNLNVVGLSPMLGKIFALQGVELLDGPWGTFQLYCVSVGFYDL